MIERVHPPLLDYGVRTSCLLTDFGILNSIACRIQNSDQLLYRILSENELEIRSHINLTEQVYNFYTV